MKTMDSCNQTETLMRHREQSRSQQKGVSRERVTPRLLGGLPLLGILVLLILSACSGDRPTEEGGLRILDPDTLWTWLDQGKKVVLMDPRPDAEFHAGHISGAVRVYNRRVGEVRAVLPFEPEVPIIFTGEDGRIPVDEEHLAHVLVDQGFPQVWWLEEGIEGWRERKYPLDGSRVFPRPGSGGP